MKKPWPVKGELYIVNGESDSIYEIVRDAYIGYNKWIEGDYLFIPCQNYPYQDMVYENFGFRANEWDDNTSWELWRPVDRPKMFTLKPDGEWGMMEI